MSRALRRGLGALTAATAMLGGVLGGLYVTSAAASGNPSLTCAGETPTAGWVGTWSTSQIAPDSNSALSERGFHDQTLREVVPVSLGGTGVRIKLSNAYGRAPLIVDDVHVAISRPGGAVEGSTNRSLRFSGMAFTVVAPGAQTTSDPVSMVVPNGSRLAVSIYLPGRTGPATWEPDALTTSYVSTPGDHAGAPGAAGYRTPVTSWFFLRSVDVYNTAQIGSVVALGDSITSGESSGLNADATWPDDLARRIIASESTGHRMAVLNAGIDGNQILNGSSSSGASAERRFSADVAAQTGVRTVMLLEGINDIRLNHGPGGSTPLNADELIAGMRNVIAQAHRDGLRIIGGTILPFAGDTGYYNAHGEAVREQVNHWILTSGAFDGAVDFDAAVSNRSDPAQIRVAFAGPLHPNGAGYQAMADAVSLGLLCR